MAYDVQDLPTCGLAFQPGFQFGIRRLDCPELVNILDRNDGLGCKCLHQFDLAVIEWLHFSSHQVDASDAVLPQHQRNAQQGSDAFVVDRFYRHGVCVQIGFGLGQVGNVVGLTVSNGLHRLYVQGHREGGHTNLVGRERFAPLAAVHQLAPFLVQQEEAGRRRVAKPRRAFQDRVEDRLFVIAALADHLQNLRASLLTLQPVLQFAELANVFDGNDGLGGKSADQFDLIIGERACFQPVKSDRSDRDAIAQKWHGQEGSCSFDVDGMNSAFMAIAISGHLGEVVDVDDLGFCG